VGITSRATALLEKERDTAMKLILLRIFLAVGVLVLVRCDHATKYIAKAELENALPTPVIGNVLSLHYTENRDTGFGLLRWIPADQRLPIILALQSLGSLVFIVALWRRRKLDTYAAAFALILAGALGNLTDRIFRGYVVDFVRLPYWPVFNVADIWISIGIGLILLATLRDPRMRGASKGS
jgi:signal peptidase II